MLQCPFCEEDAETCGHCDSFGDCRFYLGKVAPMISDLRPALRRYRCLEWGKKRLYEQKYMYLVSDEEERKFHFYITDPCTGKVDTWLPTEVEILGLWEEVEW